MYAENTKPSRLAFSVILVNGMMVMGVRLCKRQHVMMVGYLNRKTTAATDRKISHTNRTVSHRMLTMVESVCCSRLLIVAFTLAAIGTLQLKRVMIPRLSLPLLSRVVVQMKC
jgi:hypothetical protein